MQPVGAIVNLLWDLFIKTRPSVRSVVFWHYRTGWGNCLIEQIVILVGFKRNWLIESGFCWIWVQVSFQVSFEYPARTTCASMAWNRQAFIIFAKPRLHHFIPLALTTLPCDIRPHFKCHNSLDCTKVVNCVHEFEFNVSCFEQSEGKVTFKQALVYWINIWQSCVPLCLAFSILLLIFFDVLGLSRFQQRIFHPSCVNFLAFDHLKWQFAFFYFLLTVFDFQDVSVGCIV